MRATIIVADPENEQQMSEFGYGFPSFATHLRKSISALKTFRTKASISGVSERVVVGTSRKVKARSTFLSDPVYARGVAYMTHTQLGSRTKERAIVKIEKRKHPDYFTKLYDNYVGQCVKNANLFGNETA